MGSRTEPQAKYFSWGLHPRPHAGGAHNATPNAPNYLVHFSLKIWHLVATIFPGFSRTKVVFQDFPGPGILKNEKSWTIQEAWEPWPAQSASKGMSFHAMDLHLCEVFFFSWAALLIPLPSPSLSSTFITIINIYPLHEYSSSSPIFIIYTQIKVNSIIQVLWNSWTFPLISLPCAVHAW